MFKIYLVFAVLLLTQEILTSGAVKPKQKQRKRDALGVEYYDQDQDEDEDFAPVSPCNVVRAGDPDLTMYDIISSYHFDQYHFDYQGVQQIVGSTNYQTAYHLQEYSNLTIESSQAFPKGVPDEFSFECTFRVPQHQPQVEWYLFELTNYQYEAQMSVTINPLINTIEFSLPKYDGSIQTASFEEIEIFDRAWHKVMFGVTQDAVRLWIDCKPVPDLNGSFFAPLDVRAPIDITEGAFSVARECKSKNTVPIDLQWMIFSCDVEKPNHTGCEDIAYPIKPPIYHEVDRPEPIYPDWNWTTVQTSSTTLRSPPDFSFLTTSTQHPWLESTTPAFLTGDELHACPEQCPAGPRGLPGPPGPPGSSVGLYEIPQQLKGEKGAQGEVGLVGLQGIGGVKGATGAPGLRGPIGPPGPEGPAGLPGPPGPGSHSSSVTTEYQTINEREIRDICMEVVRDYISEISVTLLGPPGPPGRRGISRPGPTGPQGIQGERGPPGSQGERGFPGVPGVPGPQGESGPPGPDGPKGDRGYDGIGREGPIGPIGPQGPEGRGVDGIPGRPGERGDMGRPGETGTRGPPGDPGVCPDCTAYQAAYAYPMLLAQQQQNNKGPPNYYNKGPQNYYNKGP